jgi:shikimate kinase
MMGSGKSVTGKKLAELTARGFVDLDERIEARNAMAISTIFETRGEAFFRGLESSALADCAHETEPLVVATGGGIILRPENVELMSRTGTAVYLETSAGVLWARVRGDERRPLLKVADPCSKLEEILAARRSLYENSCRFRVKTDSKTAEAVAREILRELGGAS